MQRSENKEILLENQFLGLDGILELCIYLKIDAASLRDALYVGYSEFSIKKKKGDNMIKPKNENTKSKILIIMHNFLVRSEHSFTDIIYLLIC